MNHKIIEVDGKIYSVHYIWFYDGGGPEGVGVEEVEIINSETTVPVPEESEEWRSVYEKLGRKVKENFRFFSEFDFDRLDQDG